MGNFSQVGSVAAIEGDVHVDNASVVTALGQVKASVDAVFGAVNGLEGSVDGLEALITLLNGYVDGLEGFTDGIEAGQASQLTELQKLSDLDPEVINANIANGASLSGAVDLTVGKFLVALQMPAAWSAAVITFDVSYDNSTFAPMYDSTGTEKSLTVSTSRFVYLDPSQWAGIRYIKVRSGTVGSVVAQGGSRDIKLIVRPI